LRRFDQHIMKPLLVYKYERNLIERNRAFFEIFWKNGDLVEKDFLRNDGAKKLDVEEGLRLLDYDGKVMRLRQSAI